MSTARAETVPRGALIGAGAMVAMALAATGVARIAHLPPAASPALLRAEEQVAPVRSRDLRFTDRADGAVVITDTDSNRLVSVIEPGSKTGFVRAVMRGLARDRRLRGIGALPPFRLTLWRDGELSLTDTVTRRTTEMSAFGSTNRAAFAVLLGAPGVVR